MSKPKIYDHFVLVYSPKHERAMGTGYVPEHILVAEKALERSLTPDEDVRHINGNTQDNRPSNLEVISTNVDFRSQSISPDYEPRDKKSMRTFMPCKFQKPCWKEIRGPLAKREGVYLPYICSYQEFGDVYRCGHWWNFLEKETESKENV